MVINKPASFQFEHLEFKVKSDDASVETNTKNLYVLSGANNKKIIRDSNFYVHEFEQTHLNSISTIRYFSSNNITFNLMPITVGQLNFLNYPDLLDFSTMPEGNGIIKTRLSGFGTSERVESILDKDKIPKEMMQDMSYSLFTTIFPTIGEQIDFNRCVTYRNNLPNFHALSPLKLHYKGNNLYTTLGCYGVHVRYANAIATAINNDKEFRKQEPAITINESRPALENFISTTIFPVYLDRLKDSEDFKKIGRTPLTKIKDNVFIKLEGHNLTESIKDRVALHVLLKKLQQGNIKSNDTVVIATSGNYGLSVFKVLQMIRKKLDIYIKLIIVTPESYRLRPIFIALENLGISPILEENMTGNIFLNSDHLIYTKGIFTQSMAYAKSLSQYDSSLIYLDQHYDETHAEAHRSTAEEIYHQLPEVTDIVVTTGSGATLAGIYNFFSDKKVKIHSRPSENGKIPGISDSRIYGNYFDDTKPVGYHLGFFDPQRALQQKEAIKSTHGLDVGQSTGAALTLVEEIKNEDPNSVIVVISPSAK